MDSLLQDDPLTVASAFAFVAAPLLYYRIKNSKRYQVRHTLSNIAAKGKIKPPFPQVIRDMLSKCNLSYLSTVDSECSSSHLSLMRFTYVNDIDDGEVVIMSTNMQTKKYDMLTQQNGVALLIHDFGGGMGDGSNGQYSITLNGDCRIVTDTNKVDAYRQAHLTNNPDYPQFIVGENIAILCVDVTSARICNIDDQVVKWDVTEEATGIPAVKRV
jgi:hypothetical protein